LKKDLLIPFNTDLMKSNVAIKIENLSKMYRLGTISTGTLSHDLKRWFTMNIQGKEDPYLKIGETNDRTSTSKSDYVWALKDINLEIEQGDVVGIIGKNGAGKSTLLKILSKVTKPTTGTIQYKGRIASLLEVGTGFHPEMTGRENIFMNGSIMGMRKFEITGKLDEIVAFAGVERYIDTPVKRYSSGMTVRLGFSIAAHLEPDILVVDEVLAVGDAEFQKKAIGKMQDVSKGGGRTVLFVSHNMTAIQGLCRKGILMKNGSVEAFGDVGPVVKKYLAGGVEKAIEKNWETDMPGNDTIKLRSYKIYPNDDSPAITIDSGVTLDFVIVSCIPNLNLGFTLYLTNSSGILLFESGAVITDNKNSVTGDYKISVIIPGSLLNCDTYTARVVIGESQRYVLAEFEDILAFDVEHTSTGRDNNYSKAPGVIRPLLEWKTCLINQNF
jgi:lipopolysaccharide transport system ATP-binding protein